MRALEGSSKLVSDQRRIHERHVIELPVTQPTSCAFGGKNLDVLYITTARQNLTEAQLRTQPLAGGLFAVLPGTQGLPEPKFGV